jgi:ribosomal protein S27AE
MGTIEIINNLILVKTKSLYDIANILKNCNITNITSKIDTFIDAIQEISDDYEMGSVKIISDYFHETLEFQKSQELSNKIDKDAHINRVNRYFTDYQIFIRKENFVGKIERNYNTIKNLVNILTKEKNPAILACITDIKSEFALYESFTLTETPNNISYNKCPKCQQGMKIISNMSEIVCEKCGITENLYGTVFEDDQFYFQEGNRSKTGSYDPGKHCRFWIERIQARESKEIPESVLTKIRECIKHNKIRNIEEISCKEIRKYLSQTRNSIYNEHVPLIRKLITGRSPEPLLEEEVQLITIYFDKVIRVYEEIKPDTKTNVPYHPYLIYKIIEHILYKKSPMEFQKSKKRILHTLSCIHLQSRETLINNDNTWSEICDNIEEITYRPTDSNNELV